jgi:Flp pilus assembly protein TadD/predicted Zn-dependent protease with MMP-like domain
MPALPATARKEPEPRPLRRCFAERPVWVDSPVAELLDRAADHVERGDFEGVLACAEEAARQMPSSVEAHHDRAVALIRLGRLEEAKDAVTLALALAPNDVEALELAADFFINQLPPSAERTTIGLQFAKRGRQFVSSRDRRLQARLALLETQALIDLGRAHDALKSGDRALRLSPHDPAVHYERGVALFELCRFADARRAFEDVLKLEAGHAHALYHLGLIHERGSEDPLARARFKEASLRDPKSFPPSPEVSMEDFERRLQAAIDRLPKDMRGDLAGIPVQAAELPTIEDLTADQPPLSPTILGLFRGLPLGRDDARETSLAARGTRGRNARPTAEAPSGGGPANCCAVPERAIVLYRRNILRSVATVAELDAAISRTLLHEIGHLRGEDDGSLRDRGLE